MFTNAEEGISTTDDPPGADFARCTASRTISELECAVLLGNPSELRRFLISTINPQLSILIFNHEWTRMFTNPRMCSNSQLLPIERVIPMLKHSLLITDR